MSERDRKPALPAGEDPATSAPGRTTCLGEDLKAGRSDSDQICGKTWLISWSHRRRFRVAVEIAREFTGRAVFDYGCGDATFLAHLVDCTGSPRMAVGGERDPAMVEECRRRFEGAASLRFVCFEEIASEAHRGRYDAVFCMEVLEHALDVQGVLSDLDLLLAPTGKLVISVPVETGMPLLIKQCGRRLAGLKRVRGYVGHSGYTWRELAAAVFAGSRTHIPRIIYDGADGLRSYDHKGFKWAVIRDQIAERFEIQRTLGSPFTWLPPHLSSQVWLIASRRRGGSRGAAGL